MPVADGDRKGRPRRTRVRIPCAPVPAPDLPSRRAAPALAAFALAAAALALYLATLAPTVLWGDSGYFQWSAAAGHLKRDAGGHALWLALARTFIRLPWGDVAHRVNLLSAAAAAATLVALFGAMRAAGLRAPAAGVGCLALMVSHTFWMHAVRAEVYTVFTAAMAVQLWLWFAWRPGRPWPVAAAAALGGATVLAHQMAVLLVPAAAFLVWRQRAWLTPRARLACAGLLAAGLAPFAAVVAWQAAGGSFADALWAHFTRVDTDFTAALFDVHPAALPRDAALWLALLALQFPGPAGWWALRGLRDLPRPGLPATPWRVLAIAYATTAAFALSYRVNDRFAFFLPSYVIFAFFVARGWEHAAAHRAGSRIDANPGAASPSNSEPHAAASAPPPGPGATDLPQAAPPMPSGGDAGPGPDRPRRRSRRAALAPLPVLAVLAALAMPPVAYRAASGWLAGPGSGLAARALPVRALPGRDPARYFLWPPSHLETSAAAFARRALASLPPGAVLLADHTPYQPLQYVQRVEGVRRDVRLVRVEPTDDLRAAAARGSRDAAERFLADDNAAYYDLPSLAPDCVVPYGVVYRVAPAGPFGGCR